MDSLILLEAVLKAASAFGTVKVLAVMISILVFAYFALVGLIPFVRQVRYESAMIRAEESKIVAQSTRSASPIATRPNSKEPEMSQKHTSVGDVNVSGNSGSTQVNIDSPNSIQIVNQQRSIENTFRVEKMRRSDAFVITVSFSQTSGIWDQGQEFKLFAKVSGPYREAKFVQGLPPVQFNVRISENKTAGVYSYSTSTAPIPNSQIVLQFEADNDIDVSEIGVEPLAP